MGIPSEASGMVGAPRKSPVKRRDTDRTATSDRPARTRSTNSRRRTRGGEPVSGQPGGNGSGAGSEGNAVTETQSDSASSNGNGAGTPRRRRRRRKPAEATTHAN
jgi:hypothetical protein